MSFAARITRKPTVEKRRTCDKCGRLGHLKTTCTNTERHHNLIGVEIEGWWYDLPAATELARKICGTPGRADGSIRGISTCIGSDQDNPDDYNDPDVEDCEDGCDDCPHPIARRTAPRCDRGLTDCKACGARGWEFQTKPGSVGETLRQLTQLYPDVTSRAAGLHVHMSFKEKTSISLLASDAFFAYWKTRWLAWVQKLNVKGAFLERLNNENQYCRPNSVAADFTKPKANIMESRDRYRAINFQSFERHGTVEFRLLPMFQKGDLAVNAIETLVDIVETYLQTAVFDTDIEGQSLVLPKNADEAITLESVKEDFDLPNTDFGSVMGEIDISSGYVPGLSPDGETMVMLRHQIPDYYAKKAEEARAKLVTIADPKKNKVDWSQFK
jgi:hypothetical protein